MTDINSNESEQSSLDIALSSEFAELPGVLVDAFFGIPLASTLKKVAGGIDSVRDHLYRKKIIRLLSHVDEVPARERQAQLAKLLIVPGERKRFGEQLLLTLERVDDMRKATIMGNLSVGLLKGEFSLLEFLRMNRAVEAISLDEEWPILQVIEKYKETYYDNVGAKSKTKMDGWNFEGVLRDMVNDQLARNVSDGDLCSIVIRINQKGLFGCLGWRDGPAHDCKIAPWYYILKRFMYWTE